MIGRSGTSREKSVRTRIFSPPEGTLMCWYAIGSCSLRKKRPEKGAIISAFERRRGLICNRFRGPRELLSSGCQPLVGRRVIGSGLRQRPVFPTQPEKGMTMKQLVAVLVAAMFAATSFAALAQDKKMDKKSDTKTEKMDKKDGKKDGKKKAAKKDGKKKSDKKSDKMDKMDKK